MVWSVFVFAGCIAAPSFVACRGNDACEQWMLVIMADQAEDLARCGRSYRPARLAGWKSEDVVLYLARLAPSAFVFHLFGRKLFTFALQKERKTITGRYLAASLENICIYNV